jgi:hypothetical protein
MKVDICLYNSPSKEHHTLSGQPYGRKVFVFNEMTGIGDVGLHCMVKIDSSNFVMMM